MTKEQRDQEEGAISREFRVAAAALEVTHQKLKDLIFNLRAMQEDLGTFRQNIQNRNTMLPIPERLSALLERLPTGPQILSDMAAAKNQQEQFYNLEEKLKSFQRH
jgi:hypothetical protein